MATATATPTTAPDAAPYSLNKRRRTPGGGFGVLLKADDVTLCGTFLRCRETPVLATLANIKPLSENPTPDDVVRVCGALAVAASLVSGLRNAVETLPGPHGKEGGTIADAWSTALAGLEDVSSNLQLLQTELVASFLGALTGDSNATA